LKLDPPLTYPLDITGPGVGPGAGAAEVFNLIPPVKVTPEIFIFYFPLFSFIFAGTSSVILCVICYPC
jgi:hypothetical protein